MIAVLFYIAAAVALLSAVLTVPRHNAVHALLYLVITMLAISLIFFLLGAAFAAALQIIVYAGAIMVLFVFVTMMLHQGELSIRQEAQLYRPSQSFGAIVLSIVLLLETLYLLAPVLIEQQATASALNVIGAKQIGLQLFGPYLLLVEIAALLLLTALIGAFHIARRHQEIPT
ncbi:MAG: hypothetical protein OFPI_12440 [Osedax symbiont Rs2]|nr:MAG: hypothetical protein OFPI_12440 [Osedax symbiont Rs2]